MKQTDSLSAFHKTEVLLKEYIKLHEHGRAQFLHLMLNSLIVAVDCADAAVLAASSLLHMPISPSSICVCTLLLFRRRKICSSTRKQNIIIFNVLAVAVYVPGVQKSGEFVSFRVHWMEFELVFYNYYYLCLSLYGFHTMALP